LESSSPEIELRVIGADDVVTTQGIATLDDRFHTAFIVSALDTTTMDNSIIIIRLLAISIITTITNRVPPKSIQRDTSIIGLDSTK
jgi:hypothetical protein